MRIYPGATPLTARFGDVAAGNYAEFESDGTLTFYGDGTVWLDKNFAGTTLGVGNSAPDLIQVNAGTIYRRAFNGATVEEQLFGDVEIPHGWQPGNAYAHLHWQPVNANAGNVKWRLTYIYAADGETESAEATVVVVSAAPEVAWRHVFAMFPTIDLGASRPIGTQFGLRLWRDPDNVDGEDTYGSDAAVVTFGLHIEMRRLGSRQIGTY